MQINAIETQYKGYRFRSRLEARWAVFFDAQGIEWQYEIEGFELPSGRYLPDFWLPQVSMWGEVKPGPFSELELQKCKDLAVLGENRGVLLLAGQPDFRAYEYWLHYQDISHYEVVKLEDGSSRWYPQRAGCITRIDDCYLTTQYLCEYRFYSNIGWGPPDDPEHAEYLSGDPVYVKAVHAARAARFEFGEKGAAA